MVKTRTPARGAETHRAPDARKTRIKWTPRRTERFFDVLAESCNVRKAADAVGVTPSSAYKRKQRDAPFMARWGEALHVGYDQVEMGLINRAIEGTQTRTVRNGPDGKREYELVVTRFDDPSTIHLLRMHRAEVETVRRGKTQDAGTLDGIAQARALLDGIRGRLGVALELPDDDDEDVEGRYD